MSLVDNRFDSNTEDDVPVEVLVSYAEKDIAVLRTKTKLYVSHAWKVADQKSLKVGEQVYIAGYPRSIAKVLSSGTVANTTGVPNDESAKVACMILADADATTGNSGGPLFVRRGDDLYFAGIVTTGFAFLSAAVGSACFEAIPGLSYTSSEPGGLSKEAKK
ncbi:trypsin-like peptidase domain-containing protein [Candidatus Woesearchaeota archaeon]|nr:trypsin-like peptidase domain-containing protein [Candidatus Woesearchaeota archaeon]